MIRSASLFGLFVVTGCATAQIAVAPVEAARLERSLAGQTRFLRVSMYSTPFFKDSTRSLLTALPPEEVDLLDNPDGSPVSPGRVERTVAAGTRVRIRQLEFPSATVMAQRVLFTPRTLAWVYLDVAGAPKDAPPSVLVLRPGLTSAQDVLAELERYVSTEDPSPLLGTFSEAVRDAIKMKTATAEMSADALEMAWGYPAQKRLELVNAQRKETWKWPRKRWAVLLDGRVTSLSEEADRR